MQDSVMRDYEFSGIEPCAHGDHAWFLLEASEGTGEIRIPLSATDAREVLPSVRGLRSPAQIVADGLRNCLHVLGVVPEAVHLAVGKENSRVVIEAELHCAASADIALPCLAALIVGLRWDLPFRVTGVRGKREAEAPGTDPLEVWRSALEGINLDRLPPRAVEEPESGRGRDASQA